MSDWTPDPTKTQPATDGSGRRREWAFRDVSPGAPPVQAKAPAVRRQAAVAAEIDLSADVDLIADARTDQRRASAEFSREAQASARAAKIGGVSLWTVFTWIVVFGGVGYTAYGQWRGDVSLTTTSERHASNRSDTLSDLSGSSRSNRCRELLIEWIRTGKIGSMRAEEIDEAVRRIKEDGR